MTCLIDYLVGWFFDSLIHWFTDSLTQWLIQWFIDSLVHWFTGSLIHWFSDSLIHWFFDSSSHYLTHSLIQMVGCFIDSLIPWFTAWLVHRLIHWFIASFLHRLADSSIHFSCAWFFHAMSLATQPLCADSLMHLTTTTMLLHLKNLPIGHLLPLLVSYSPTSTPARAGHYWDPIIPLFLLVKSQFLLVSFPNKRQFLIVQWVAPKPRLIPNKSTSAQH